MPIVFGQVCGLGLVDSPFFADVKCSSDKERVFKLLKMRYRLILG
jgi:hypothetical protein